MYYSNEHFGEQQQNKSKKNQSAKKTVVNVGTIFILQRLN